MMQPANGHRVQAVYAILTIGDDGDEGVPAFLGPDGETMMPLIASDIERLSELRHIAHLLMDASGRKWKIAKFTERIDLETHG